MTTTTTTSPQGWRTAGGRDVPATLTLTDDQALALVRAAAAGASESPWSPSIGRAAGLLVQVLDCGTLADAVAALTYSGARHALVAAVSAAQHGQTWQDIASSEGDGTIAATFLRLALATASLVRQEDSDVAALGDGRGDDETWCQYVTRAGRVALVRSLRAPLLAVDERSDDPAAARTTRASESGTTSRTPAADDPSVTAPRAPRTSRSPGAAVRQPRKSRSERTRDALARGAAVTADALGGDLPRLLGTGDKGWQQSIVGDPWCPIAAGRRDDDEPHACTPSCWGLGGWHQYSPRQGAAQRSLPAGVAGPVAPERDVALVWRPFHAFPVGSAVVREYLPSDDPSRERGRVRLAWRPARARQSLTATVKGRRVTFTPATFQGATAQPAPLPSRTAAHLAAGGTFHPDVVTRYGALVWVGHRRQQDSESRRPQRTPAQRAPRRTLTAQQAAVVTLLADAVTLVQYDGRSRVAHRDDQGRGWVIARTSDLTLTLLSPAGVTSPLPSDPRKVTAALRAAVLVP